MLHHREENGEASGVPTGRSLRVLWRRSCSCGAPSRARLLPHSSASSSQDSVEFCFTREHARTHHRCIAMRRVRGLPGASQLSFRVINDMRSYRGTHHPVPRRRVIAFFAYHNVPFAFRRSISEKGIFRALSSRAISRS